MVATFIESAIRMPIRLRFVPFNFDKGRLDLAPRTSISSQKKQSHRKNFPYRKRRQSSKNVWIKLYCESILFVNDRESTWNWEGMAIYVKLQLTFDIVLTIM